MLYAAGHFQLSLLKVSEKLQLHASHGEDRDKVHTMLSNFYYYYFYILVFSY